MVRDFTGHGIGETFHSGLYVPHYDKPDLDTVMEPGMTFTIEPMITLGTHQYEMWRDGWTVVTKDRKWTAQFEHTVVVTDDGLRDPDPALTADRADRARRRDHHAGRCRRLAARRRSSARWTAWSATSR